MEALSPSLVSTTNQTRSRSLFVNWGGLVWAAALIGVGLWALVGAHTIASEVSAAGTPVALPALARILTLPDFTLFGLSALLLLCAISTIVTGRGNPLRLAMGADGRLSVSKFQVLVWTAVTAYCYIMLYAARALTGHGNASLSEIPSNVLVAMGLSLTTAVGAKVITVSQIANAKIAKTVDSAATLDVSDLVNTDADAPTPDLTKIQLVFWTLVAAATFCLRSHMGLEDDIVADRLPDIDTALLVLMGMGQGGYLGSKYAAATNPRLLSLTPSNAKAGTTITISGADLGSSGVLLLNGTPYWGTMQPVWSNDTITFELPAPIGFEGWTTNTLVAVGARCGGRDASSTLAFVTT